MSFRGFLGKAAAPLFFLLGVFLLVWTVRTIGVSELLGALSFLRGPGFLVLLYYPASSIWDAWGWVYAFPDEDRPKARVAGLFWVRLAGEAMNNLTPLADWGGEPLKARLLQSQLRMSAASAGAAVILAKSVLFFSEVLYWAVGLAPAFVLPLAAQWKWVFGVVFAVCAAISLVLALYQKKGMFGAMGKWAGRFLPQATWTGVDERMALFYRRPLRGFWPSFVLHFIGWAAGGVETWLMLKFMGTGVGLGESLAIEALLQLTRTATFFVPASVGVQEAGMALVFGAFGFAPSHGVALSLVKRVRQLLWSAIGLGVWGCYQWRGPAK